MSKKSSRKQRQEKRTEERQPRWKPSEEDFARAHAYMLECDRGLGIVGDKILSEFQQRCPDCYGFYVLWQEEPSFRAYFFVEGRGAVERFTASEDFEFLQKRVYDELNNVGRGTRDEISVEFVVQDRSMFFAK